MLRYIRIVLSPLLLLAALWLVYRSFGGSGIGRSFASLNALTLIGAALAILLSSLFAGLRVRSIAGLPRFSVALADVEGVAVVRVDPTAEFGGWGFRLGLDGRFGIVLRAGDAIQVERRRGRTLVVTVDDAATGAGLLSALADRSRAARP